MARSRHDPEVKWYTANKRGIIPLDHFCVSRKVHRKIHSNIFRRTVNQDFRRVIEGCAGRESTWISQRIIDSFEVLHKKGYAHSIEIYRNDRLIGGLYGVALQSAFFAESMFQFETDAAKIALFHCHDRLKKGGFRLWDAQFFTPHLAQFGCIEIDSGEYDKLLQEALRYPAKFDG